jgi:hypothetical protein
MGMKLRPMSGGELLDQAFQLYRSRFPMLLLVALVCYAPLALVFAVAGADPLGAGGVWSGELVGSAFVSVIVATACTAALTRVADGAVAGLDIGVGAGLVSGLRLTPRLILMLILAYLLAVGSMIPGGIVFALIAGASSVVPAGPARTGVAVAGGVVGITVMAVGLIWCFGIGMLSLPAMVAENLGALASLKRANALAKGRRIRIAGLGILAWLIVLLPSLGLSFLLGFGSALIHPALAQTMSAGRLYLQRIIGMTTSALTLPYMITVLVLLYYDGRVRREGYDVEQAVASLEGHA